MTPLLAMFAANASTSTPTEGADRLYGTVLIVQEYAQLCILPTW